LQIFEPELMFVARDREYPEGGSIGLAPALFANIRIGWKGLARPTTLFLITIYDKSEP